VETNSTGGQGSRRAVAPSDDDDGWDSCVCERMQRNKVVFSTGNISHFL
jgi:hypothetical protein